ncbi:MAG: GNAT family N-acetyltransferase [Deltaproteobacteria bacterium]|nr:GNAT family N-acetyltransferase [Deltaproteobacteria bacterium]
MLIVNHPESPEEFEEYYDLRWRVLREPWSQPRGSEKDEFDPIADHVTVRDEDGKLIGIGRLHLNNDREAQIRYMATEEDARGCGAGRVIIERLETIARERDVHRITLNAREHQRTCSWLLRASGLSCDWRGPHHVS